MTTAVQGETAIVFGTTGLTTCAALYRWCRMTIAKPEAQAGLWSHGSSNSPPTDNSDPRPNSLRGRPWPMFIDGDLNTDWARLGSPTGVGLLVEGANIFAGPRQSPWVAPGLTPGRIGPPAFWLRDVCGGDRCLCPRLPMLRLASGSAKIPRPRRLWPKRLLSGV